MRRTSHRQRRPRTKIGAPPGTLIHVGERKTERTRIRLIRYDAERLEEQELERVEQCLEYREGTEVAWLNIDGIHDPAVIEEAGRCFGLHPLVQEDILNTDQRPKLEDYDDYLFLVLKMLQIAPGGGIQTEQVSLVIGPAFVLSFQEKEGDVFDGVRDRLRSNKGRIRKAGPDYLAYALLDLIIDHYFLILEELGDRIELLEEELIASPSPPTLQKIHRFKREMIHLRKSVWPLREVVNGLQRKNRRWSGRHPVLPAGHLRPYHPGDRNRRDLPRHHRRDARYLPVQPQQPDERGHEGADHHRHHLHPPDLYRRRLRHEFRLHAGTALEVGLSRRLGGHAGRRRRHARLFPQEKMVLGQAPGPESLMR